MLEYCQFKKPLYISDFLGISFIFSGFQKIVKFEGRIIWRFMKGSADGWTGSVVALAWRWAQGSKPEVDSERDYLEKK